MGNLTPLQIVAIGAALVFGIPIAVGFVVGHFFGLWLGVASGGSVLLFIFIIAHRQLMKRTREEKETKEEDEQG